MTPSHHPVLTQTLSHLAAAQACRTSVRVLGVGGGGAGAAGAAGAAAAGAAGAAAVGAAGAAGAGFKGEHYDVEPLQTDLSGLVALVTGGARGLGSAIALSLAASGAAVVVHYSKSEAEANEIVSRITASGGRAHPLQADLTDTAACKQLVHSANAVLGKVDILVSNAGLGNATPIEETTDEEWAEVFDINTRATMALARELLPQMRARRFGRFITVSSIVGMYGTRGGDNVGGGATYAAAKAALIAFTKGIAHEGSPYITANVVCPGPTNPDPRHLREPDPPIAEDGSANWLGETSLRPLADGLGRC